MPIKRLYDDVLEQHFREERQMLFLMGPRQVGKTTTSREVAGRRETSSYLNWDDFDHRERILAGPSSLAGDLGVDRLHETRPLQIFDELHKYPRWRNFVKGFFDTYGDRTDLLVTGSARLSAFHAGGDSLMGRYFSYRMHPLSLAELAQPEATTWAEKRGPRPVDDGTWQALLEYGGFPEPLERQNRRFTNRWHRLRAEQLFREELRDLTRIQETAKVQMLAQLVAAHASQLTSLTTLANALDASIDSVKRWLATLGSFYYCFALRPWFRNVARSLRKEPKLYLWDWSLVKDPGQRLENLVACALLKAVHFWTDHGVGLFDLHFVRDKEKREVDFLVSRDGEPWLMIEVKAAGRQNLSPSLLHHSNQLGAPVALQVAFDLPYEERDCFALERPTIVPARTFLSQLV